MSVKHIFLSPEQILFGIGAVEQLGDCVISLKGKKVFILTDKVVAGLDSFKTIETSLKKKTLNTICIQMLKPIQQMCRSTTVQNYTNKRIRIVSWPLAAEVPLTAQKPLESSSVMADRYEIMRHMIPLSIPFRL